MVQIEYLPIVLTGICIIVSILYYTSVLRNANTQRQTQLYMQAFQELNQEKRWREYVETRYFTEWVDYADFQEKYGRGNPEFYAKLNSMWWIYNTIGMLIYEGLIDAKRVYGLMGPMGSVQWDKWREIIYELRKDLNMPSAYIGFEHLGVEMKKLEAEGYPTNLANEISKIKA